MDSAVLEEYENHEMKLYLESMVSQFLERYAHDIGKSSKWRITNIEVHECGSDSFDKITFIINDYSFTIKPDDSRIAHPSMFSFIDWADDKDSIRELF